MKKGWPGSKHKKHNRLGGEPNWVKRTIMNCREVKTQRLYGLGRMRKLMLDGLMVTANRCRCTYQEWRAAHVKILKMIKHTTTTETQEQYITWTIQTRAINSKTKKATKNATNKKKILILLHNTLQLFNIPTTTTTKTCLANMTRQKRS